MKALTILILLTLWVCGVVLAKGFWSTAFALFFPFWGWYLVAERAMTAAGLI